MPFLTRPGQKCALCCAGRPQDWDHNMRRRLFHLSRSLLGSLTAGRVRRRHRRAGDYQALAVLDWGAILALLGAFSVDVTHSRATLPEVRPTATAPFRVTSFRASYAKDFMI
ncbi:fimbria/pilus outer membrane usher protein [Salmonella enterica subsp. enterica serovar Weltevreden]|nr:fimbria/pilus outer membrane usher protein [Salmonella enterica subsp. enterica serovar Weltevreden]